ncbi:MAG: Inner membrane transport permease yadH, partial [Veillonella sp. DORA_B_18_19_23]
GRLDADGSGDSRGLADRAAGVRTQGKRGLKGADGGRRSTRGAARDTSQVPGVGGAVEGRMLGRATHGELIEVRLAQDRHAGRTQVCHGGGVARGLFVGILVTAISLFFVPFQVHSWVFVALTLVLTAVLFSLAGLLNGVFAKTFDDISLVPTFVLTPLTYLGGVFYSLTLLPP